MYTRHLNGSDNQDKKAHQIIAINYDETTHLVHDMLNEAFGAERPHQNKNKMTSF